MSVREYVGARYVPLFMGDWSDENAYEPLSIVQYQGNSYTSRQSVPTGIPITDTTYWALTGNYNAQVEAYRQEVASVASSLDDIENEIDILTNTIESVSEIIPSSDFTSMNTVKNYVDNEIDTVSDIISSFISNNDSLLKLFDCGFDKQSNNYYKIFEIPRSINPIIDVSPLISDDVYTSLKLKPHLFSCNCGFVNTGLISNNEIVFNAYMLANRFLFGIKNDIPTFEYIENPTPIEYYLQQGYSLAFCAWCPILTNGVKFDWENQTGTTIPNTLTEKHTRSFIGWNDDNWYIGVVEGMVPFSRGATFNELYNLINKFNIPNAFNMDGGGSSQIYTCNPIFNHVTQNKELAIDNYSQSRPKALLSFDV